MRRAGLDAFRRSSNADIRLDYVQEFSSGCCGEKGMKKGGKKTGP